MAQWAALPVRVELDLANANTVPRGRAEDLAGEFGPDVVTCPGLSPRWRSGGGGLLLVRPGGLILAILKGACAAAEEACARPASALPAWRHGSRGKERWSGIVNPAATVATFTARPPSSRSGRPRQDGSYPGQQTSARAVASEAAEPLPDAGPPQPEPWTRSPRLTQPAIAHPPASRVAASRAPAS